MIRSSRTAICGIFFAAGLGMATWLASLPRLAATHDLSTLHIGLALLGMEMAGILTVQFWGYLMQRKPRVRYTIIAIATFAPCVAFTGVITSITEVLIAACLLGSAFGALDMAMNARATIIEKTYHKRVLGKCYGWYSLGSLAGAIIAVMVTGYDIPRLFHTAGIAVTLFIIGGLSWLMLQPVPLVERQSPYRLQLPTRATLPLAILALGATFADAGISDWAGVYTLQQWDDAALYATAAYGIFTAGMVAGRLHLERSLRHRSARVIIGHGGLLAAIAFTVFLYNPVIEIALAALFCCGLGIAGIFPLLLRYAGQSSDNPEQAIAAVLTFAYAGYLLAPATVGLLSANLSLQTALLLIVLACAGIARNSSSIRRR